MASTFKIILAVSGIFVAGAITGGVVSVRVVNHLAQKNRVVERIGPNEIGGRLAEQLQLTPEQRDKIRPLLTRTSDEMRKLRREAFTQTAALVANLDAELSKVLTEEQRMLLKDVRAKEDERRKQWMAERARRNEGRPPEGPGGEGPRGPRPPEPPRPPAP